MRLGQGRDNAKTFLIENPDIASEIAEKITAAVKNSGIENLPEAASEEQVIMPADPHDSKTDEAPKKRISIDVAVDDE